MPRNYIGGVVEGVNFPVKSFSIDVDKCNDMIIVDRKYFLSYINLIQEWALSFEKKD